MILSPVREQAFHGQHHDELFPLITLRQLEAAGDSHTVEIEVGREAATLVMLAAAGLAIAGNFRQWLAGFMISFGVWDIFYYVFLRVLLGWPKSLATWDLLFLMPVPWASPVVAPVLVSLSMIAAGAAILWRDAADRPIEFRASHWALILGGGLTVIVAFCWDWRHTMSGGWPHPFHWPLFALGEAIGMAGFLHACLSRAKRT